MNCCSGKDSTDYDIVVGGVTNDKVFNTVELFLDGLIDKKEAINRLRYKYMKSVVAFTNAVSDSCEPAIIPDIIYRRLMGRLLL